MVRPRRRALLAALCTPLLATAACAPTRRIEIPRVRSAERLLGEGPLALGPEEGVVAGVAIAAWRLAVSQGLNLSLARGGHARFILADAAGGQVSIPFRPVLDDTAEVEEAGAVLWITPFAMRLRAGRHRVIGQAVLPADGLWRMMTYADALPIDVVAGEAVNIGGIGRLSDELRFADRAARDASCPPDARRDNAFHGFLCSRTDRRFLRQDTAGDRERILARFPGLAGLQLLDRPPAPVPGWPAWPGVLMRPA